jgi:hypothetical protein
MNTARSARVGVREREREELEELATRINREHRAGQAAMRKGIGHYVACGQALRKAKEACQRDGIVWQEWLKVSGRRLRGSRLVEITFHPFDRGALKYQAEAPGPGGSSAGPGGPRRPSSPC